MNKQDQERLEQAGIDVAQGIGRVMGNEDLYVKLLGKFLQDKNYPDMVACIQNDNLQEAGVKAHALKGVSGNLGMNELQALSLAVERELKEGRQPEGLERLKECYHKIEKEIKQIV
ncbi:Hpt domain-containing protein [Christensenellaceae bacterium OttesenSCG-928-K19]|nr:Hpt domain-containing protein [Christensenellaceae bacterium OttesenSCG-928-K19]